MREGAEFRELMLQIVRTRMAFRRSMQRTLRKNNAGITFEMLQVLSSLWHEQGISQQILAERIAKDKACLTNLMNNLEKKGYVHRKEDLADRRNKLVFLTPEGEEFKEQIEKGGFILAHWDGTTETEEKIKEETKATIRCIPLDGEEEEGKCVYTGKPSKRRVIFARNY